MAFHSESPCIRYFAQPKRRPGILACATVIFRKTGPSAYTIPTSMPFTSWEISSRQQVRTFSCFFLNNIIVKKTPFFHRIGTVISFTPIIRPPDFPDARKVAYLNNAPLPGPDMHPNIWEYLPPIQLPGRIFRMRTIYPRLTVS